MSFCSNNGLAYYAAVNEAWKYFPDKPGLTSGIILAGFGAGAFFFDNISTAIINPDDVKVGTPEFTVIVQERFVLMLRWLVVCWACLAVIGMATVWKAPEALLRKMSAMRAEKEEQINLSKEADTTDRLTLPTYEEAVLASDDFDPSKHASIKEMVLSRQSVVLFFVATMSIFTGFFIMNQTKNFAILNGLLDDKDLALIMSLGSIFNTLRFLWSWWLDHSTLKIVFGTLLVAQITLNFTIFFVDKNWYTYALWTWLFMFCEGGHFTLLPNIMFRIFGSKAVAIYGWFGCFCALASLTQVFLDDWFMTDTL